ncbi:MAG: discoidin domain-containing protein [Sedimentisphaerales bacterium]|nr:discoidin domain-containing protein [Sedimentisphaerales bacterium]
MKKVLFTTSLIVFCLLVVDQAVAYDLILENYALGASVTTRDVGFGWTPNRLVDGNVSTGYHSATNTDTENWAEVDLGQPRDFDRIEVVNRTDCCSERLTGVVAIAIDASQNIVFVSDPIQDTPPGGVVLIDNNGAGFSGVQYIRLEQTAVQYLQVMELRAVKFKELKYTTPDQNIIPFIDAVAMQDTSHASYPASNAIDGNYSNFTHTDESTPNNYWQLDMGGTYFIDKIVVYNRTSCCGERLINQILTVMDEDGNVVYEYQISEADGVVTGSVHTFDLPDPAYGRFVKIGLQNDQPNGQADGNNFTVSLAEVEVLGSVFQGAWDPTPENGAVEVDVDQDLSWMPGEDPNGLVAGTTGYLLYWGTDEIAVLGRDASVQQGGVIPVGNETFDPGTMDKDTTYYWVVDQRLQDDANSIPGPLWSFTTPLTLPTIDSQPVNALTISGGYAKFTISATDPLGEGITYAWHKVGSGTILSTSDTLELIDVTDGDAGEYVCEVSNINTISSNIVELRLARPVVRWKFDEASGKVATDSSGNEIDGTLGDGFTDEEWIVDGGRTGQAGDNAISFPGNANTTVTALGVDLTAKPVNNIFLGSSSWTINLWLNIPSTAGISMIGGFGDNVFSEGSGLNDRYYNTWDGTIEFNFGEDGFWETAFTPGQWQMWTLTYDSASDTLTYYRDRVVIETKTASLIDVTENAFKLGVGDVAWADTEVPLKALIDDFSVWDEALGPFELGMLDKGYGCTQDLPGDVDDNCMINLVDLAALASGWLDCGLVPDCLE